jgi:hypothetical protein
LLKTGNERQRKHACCPSKYFKKLDKAATVVFDAWLGVRRGVSIYVASVQGADDVIHAQEFSL